MALRVLMADESSTIKRVIQLALQDYAVEVKSVPIGLDVLPVTKSFKPDIIFADVLLPKRSGYDVCMDLKGDPQTQNIPVILMWSGFMELDEKKFLSCGANDKLEKPFEADQLRAFVQNLVPKVNQNPVSAFLKFPKMPDFEEGSSLQKSESHKVEAEPLAPEEVFTLPELNPDEEFHQVPLHMSSEKRETEANFDYQVEMPSSSGYGSSMNQTHSQAMSLHPSEESWSRKDLSHFKINIPEESYSYQGLESEYKPAPVNDTGSFEEIIFETPKAYQTSAPGPSALDLAMAEKVLREEAQKMLEGLIWKILPEIAERVVKEEINKLIHETEKSI